MGCSVGDEGIAILQLRKWCPSQFPFDLSEFREAFISPTKELLLLLSYHCEALLFPLIPGDSVDCNNVENCYDGSLQDPCSSSLSRSDSKDDAPCTSGSVVDFDNGFSHERNFSRSNSYSFVSDVNSLAWGVCGDTYNQHKDTSFRELLFVSGDQCVTVHAFRHPSDISSKARRAMQDNFGQGRWVEWGPSSTLVHSVEVEESSSLFCEAPGDADDEYITNGNRENSHDMHMEARDDESLRGVGSKRWLRSFFTKAETIKSDGGFWTRFPEESSFPESAKVVSFTIFDSNLSNLEIPANGNSVSLKEDRQENVLDLKKDVPTNSHLASSSLNFQSDVLPDLLGIDNNISFKCTRVFSRNSHDLLGFLLALVDPLSVSVRDGSERNRSKHAVLVSRLSSWGIQWVSAVKLEESLNGGSMIEWTDFCFTDELLVCLSSSGFIFFYAAMSGDYVAKLDIPSTYGLSLCSSLQEQEKLSTAADMQVKQEDEVCGTPTCHQHGHFDGRMFKKLIAASHTTLLAVVDEYSVIYVIGGGDDILEKYSTSTKLLAHSSQLGLGMLVGWGAGGSDIGHQRVHSCFSSSHNHGFNQIFHGKGRRKDIFLNGFSAASKTNDQTSCDSEAQLHLMRKIFLPTDRYAEDDCICFSSLGITRLAKKHHTKEQNGAKVVHFDLHMSSAVHDDSFLNPGLETFSLKGRKESSVVEAVGCTFQGCFYLVTEGGLSVVLPAISVSPNFLPIETIGYRQACINTGVGSQIKSNLEMEEFKQPWSPWKVEILDRVLLYEGPEEADRLCLENGERWELKISRMRRLQMALEYMKFDEIKKSLEMLVDVNLVEEGILRLIFAAVYLMTRTNGNDNESSTASRLLAVATSFVTKMIRKYGLQQQKNDAYLLQGFNGNGILPLPPILPDEEQNEMENCKRLYEMAQFLEIIRNLQSRLSAKLKKPGQGPEESEEALCLVDPNLPQDESQLSIVAADVGLLDTVNQREIPFTLSEAAASDVENLALMPHSSLSSKAVLELEDSGETSLPVPQGAALRRKVLPLENPKEMIARWKIDKLDLKTVVKDALLSGRLPLAVLQLHLNHSTEFSSEEEHHDTFTEVRDIGRAIAYDLFLKGETGLAVATLQRLGEDIEICLKQLVFGTVRRSLRMQIAEEMRKYGYLGSYEWKMLERMSLLQCGEVDGVVLGSWTNVNESSSNPVIDEENAHIGYWVAAAVWSNVWDQRTIDRIVLDQPFHMGVHVLWESQLEYHICHNDWEEVSKLLEFIPASVLSEGSLQIALDVLQPATVGCNSELPDFGNYICSIEDLDAVCLDVPKIKVFRFSANGICSTWLRMLMEQELAKKFVFLKEYWEGTGEIVSLLARSGFIMNRNKMSPEDDSIESFSDLNLSNIGRSTVDTLHALHKLLVHHCAEHNLPNLLDLYLDHHKLVQDNDLLCSLQEAAGNCHWARWLLFSRVKGHEYDAAFSNARSTMSHSLVSGSNLSVPEIDDIIHTVDDIAEGGGEMAALATLMYAPAPIQNCLSSGSIRHSSSSAQCTLENLRPTLQRFPTLWRTLVAACFGEEPRCNFLGPKAKNDLSDYLNWRDSIFFSSGRDTSLSQILPCWFPKAVRRLIQLYVQGPLGWQSPSGLPTETLLQGDVDFFTFADGDAEVSAISWEATIQKHIEEELYDASLKETGIGLEHHLHRGRALAAFNQLLGVRIEKMKSEGRSSSSALGLANVQSDVQTLLAPIIKNEEFLLSSVMPLAISHFEDSVLVASCTFFLELCGLSASLLRVDVSALRRISSFYKSSENAESYKQLSPKSSAFYALPHEGDITKSLARALADEYLQEGSATKAKQKGSPSSVASARPSRALLLVLQHLEKASLPVLLDGKTCGSWLLTGNGDGTELRSQQKAASQHWDLVTVFCQMHQLPLSTKYLAVLAQDNDWVGFLYEAQVGGYPFEIVVQVASKEFSDPRLKIHILTVLRSLQSRKKASSSLNSGATESSESSVLDENLYIPVELFRILADCEKQKSPGQALLIKAKELSWETSSIKVNDIASQIADNVAAAVKATNAIPADGRALTFHYNRQSPKRRRLIEPISADPLVVSSDVSISYPSSTVVIAQGSTGEEGKKKVNQCLNFQSDSVEGSASLSKMVAVLCEQHLFLPLLRAFEMFLPSCSFLPFIRALQMRLSEASAHLGSFSARIKEESSQLPAYTGKEGQIGTSWVSSTAVQAADAMLSACPSPYEKRCLLQLLAATDFGVGSSAATYYRRLYWKINLAEPSLRKDDGLHLGNETLDDASLLTALERNGQWDQARNWAKQLDASGGPWKSTVHRVTENQAESLVAEWKEFLWDVPEERVALWSHCQTLFIRYSFPPLQAGLFFLKHAEKLEKDLPAKELLEMLLLSLQWLSGMITQSNPVYPLHLLREIETRVWLLAVESEAQVKSEGDFSLINSTRENSSNIIDQTANIITKMDNHINTMRKRIVEKHDLRENNQAHFKSQFLDVSSSTTAGGSSKTKRRAKGFVSSRRQLTDSVDRSTDSEDSSGPPNSRNDSLLPDESSMVEMSFPKWEERVEPAELERAVLSLLEVGQITAAKQLQHKLFPAHIPSEFILVDTALKLASISTPSSEVSISILDEGVLSVLQSCNIPLERQLINPLQVLESLVTSFPEGSGRGICKRIIAVVKAANVLGLQFSEAFNKQPVQLLQLLSLKAQESFEEAHLLVQTHSMPAASIAQILAESFLKGLLAAHRGGYMDSQKEEGPAPLLWRFSDFLKWAELCPSEPEIGHALMRLVITGQEMPHACEVELLILCHHFYKSSACLDGVDVLVALAATRVEAYVYEGDFPCLARLITGVGNFHALNFILGILIENGQLDLLLQKYSAAADTNTGTAEAVRGFRMAVLTSLKHFNSNDLDAFAMVYNHFDMKHETAALLESRAEQSSRQWFYRVDKDQNEDLLESMRYFIEAAEVHSSIDAGNKTRRACAQASLVSLQIRMPDSKWLNLSETNARRALVEQSRFQEALIVAEAYGLNQPSEWALVLWNQMLNPERTEEFVAEFVAVLPLQPSMLGELAKFYRAEVAARGDQSQFSVWLTGGGLPAEWAKYLGRSFRCLLKRTRDLRLRLQLATVATGFNDVVNACSKALDRVPENAGPLVLRRGHGGAYLPLM
ncbi:Spatacsin C domain-containing protein [Citrus sinensis]|nr:Spatacsin C domain-containing protein [Citrus sinensis]